MSEPPRSKSSLGDFINSYEEKIEKQESRPDVPWTPSDGRSPEEVVVQLLIPVWKAGEISALALQEISGLSPTDFQGAVEMMFDHGLITLHGGGGYDRILIELTEAGANLMQG